MGKVLKVETATTQDLVQLDAQLAELQVDGPDVHLAVVKLQGERDLTFLGWNADGNGQIQERPTFVAQGTIRQGLMAVEEWVKSRSKGGA
jgi:hypothetical protein